MPDVKTVQMPSGAFKDVAPETATVLPDRIAAVLPETGQVITKSGRYMDYKP